MRILYVEDEKLLAEAVIHLLKKANILVDYAMDGEDGLRLAKNRKYDCLVLDIMLPGISGMEILKTLRVQGDSTPVIMLSALSQTDDKVNALEAGADDYLAKPFKTAELIARIKALNRRPPVQEEQIVTYGDICYDLASRTLNDEPLTAKEAEMLELFLRHPDQVITKERILAYVWGDEASGLDNYVEVYISYLRKKMHKLGLDTTIKTVRGLGYKLLYQECADV